MDADALSGGMQRHVENSRLAHLTASASMAQTVVSELSKQQLLQKSPDVDATVKDLHEGGILGVNKVGRHLYAEMEINAVSVSRCSTLAKELGGVVDTGADVEEIGDGTSHAGTTEAGGSQVGSHARTSQVLPSQGRVMLRTRLDRDDGPDTVHECAADGRGDGHGDADVAAAADDAGAGDAHEDTESLEALDDNVDDDQQCQV